MNPKISVIMPCYNVSEYIEVAIQSILDQTLGIEQIQFIIVDDASTDEGKTIEKIRKYEREYPEQILLIPLETNLRQGGARNVGLQYATGDYVVYLDADDWYVPEALERLYQLATDYDCDVIEFGIHDVLEYPKTMPHIDLKSAPVGELALIESVQDRKNFIMSDESHKGVKKCYRRTLLQEHEIRFVEHAVWEEPSFTYVVQFYEKRHLFLSEDLYYSLRHPGSTMESSYEEKKYDNMITIDHLYQDLIDRGFGELYQDVISYLYFHWYYYSTLMFATLRETFYTREELKQIQEKTRERVGNIRENEYYQIIFRGKEIVGDLLYTDVDRIGIENLREFWKNYCKIHILKKKNG